ncbi:MAG: rhodanese-like domain-containing protein [Gammaproteobacteria bacterium]|nr:rhodanese-like domain-containing protein [Gammaproteobacteria bacterium]
MNTTRFLKSLTFLGLISMGLSLASLNLQAAEVNITAEVESVAVRHGDSEIKIMRNQNQKNTVNPAFAKTSRKCPPFCIQPSSLAPGVETIAELEVLDYLKRMSDGDDSIVVIDSRTRAWVAKGTIPGAINIPWTTLNPAKGADPISIGEILEGRFNAQNLEGLWDYRNARTLVMFCNGMWCGQSPNNIKNLLGFGYPAHKIKWYRGGMQSWEILGLTTAKPISE